MSRIGKYPVVIPAGVTVEINNNVVTVKGKLGELSCSFDANHVSTKVEDGKVVVAPLSDNRTSRSFINLFASRKATSVAVPLGSKSSSSLPAAGFACFQNHTDTRRCRRWRAR